MDTREEIRSRMLRDVARLWGYQEMEMDEKAFDPVVGLLVGACASEFAKLRQEMSNSRQRILDQLADTLTPDVLMAPSPAHTVVHVRAIEPETLILPTHQVYYTKTFGNEEKEMYFSTPAPYRLVDGGVHYLVAAGNVFDVMREMPRRDKVLDSDTYRRLQPAPSLWIGLEIHETIESLDGLSFFFNWKNEARLRLFLRQLPYCRWFLDGFELATEKGLREQSGANGQPAQATFEAELSPAWRMKQRVDAQYKDHFITLVENKSTRNVPLQGLKKNYPEVFETLFPREDLLVLNQKRLWLRVEFPEYFPSDALSNVECQINCVPILNKRFYEQNQTLQEMVNILPLPCEDFFFDVHRVVNELDQAMSAHPLSNLRNLTAGSYTLRTRGVGKMDSRAASQHLYHTLDLLRDESAAFAAFDLNTLNEKIKNLNKEITALEQLVKDGDGMDEEIPYLVVKLPKGVRNQMVNTEYWSTAGELANDIPGGTKLDMYATKGFNRASIQLMLATSGGANRKTSSDAFFEFKKSLVTRDRVVSKEDIKTFCFATLGKRLEQVTIQKGIHISDIPNEGMVRTLDVLVKPITLQTPRELQEWNALCFELESELNAKSAGLLPIRVLTN